jgi:hypothetical protein
MFRSSMYAACPAAAARKSSTLTPPGPVRPEAPPDPIGLAIGVFEPIMSMRKELALNGTDTCPWTSRTGTPLYKSLSFP